MQLLPVKFNNTQFFPVPDSGSVAVDMDDIEVWHGGVAHGHPRLVLKLIQGSPLREGVDGQNLETNI